MKSNTCNISVLKIIAVFIKRIGIDLLSFFREYLFKAVSIYHRVIILPVIHMIKKYRSLMFIVIAYMAVIALLYLALPWAIYLGIVWISPNGVVENHGFGCFWAIYCFTFGTCCCICSVLIPACITRWRNAKDEVQSSMQKKHKRKLK